jgi:hypothetical protein
MNNEITWKYSNNFKFRGDLTKMINGKVANCEPTSVLRALIKYPQGNLEEIQQKTLQSTQEEPGGRQDRKA